MYTISKEFAFEASHQLRDLPDDHACSRLHGHSYKVIVTLQSETLNYVGFVRDYRELDTFKRYLDTTFDHHHLNDVLEPINPTAENIARVLYDWCAGRWIDVVSVTVCETAKTSASYSKRSLGSVPSDNQGATL